MKIRAILVSGIVSSNSMSAQNLYSKQFFGERSNDKVVYSLVESFYLLKSGKMEIFNHQDKLLTVGEVERKFFRLDKNFNNKFFVFKDLRDKGYVVKSALKFGADFLVYGKGEKPGKSHSKWVCFVTFENKSFSWQDFSARNRVAHSTRKSLLIAIVDERFSVSYFEVNWTKP